MSPIVSFVTSKLSGNDVAAVAACAVFPCIVLWGANGSRGSLGLVICAVAIALVIGFKVDRRGRDRDVSPKNMTDTCGPYVLGEKIGAGGMGEVYRARHAMMDRDVAIKILPTGHDEEALARFEREVTITSHLESPNTVAVHDCGRTTDGRPYYAMELVDGQDLEKLVRAYGPQRPRRVVRILRQICRALEEAHASGLVHRDIKPANIGLCERAGRKDVVKLFDFGLVAQLDETNTLSDSTLVGTPAYLAPEAILSPSAIDARVDLYAVGAVAYWLLTGTPVFNGSSIVEICSHHLHTQPEAPSSRLGHDLPVELEAVVMRCLAKDPSARWSSARELREALEACDCADEGRFTARAIAEDSLGLPSWAACAA
jgi:serine/threonine-protein kinase